MKKEGSSRKLNLVLNLIFILNFFVVLSQKQISYQGFDSSSEDNWNYNSTLNSGSIGVNSSTYFSSPNSLRLGGSSSSTPDDPYISFDNVNISNYTNVILNLYFSSNGTPDDNDDLFLGRTKMVIESMRFTKEPKSPEMLELTCVLPCVYTGILPLKSPFI